MKRHKWYIATVAGMMLVTVAYSPKSLSEQIRFNRNGAQYQYQWYDADRQLHRLDFKVQGYPYTLSQFTRFTRQQANQYIVRELRREIGKIDPTTAQVSIEINDGVPRVSVTSRDASIADNIINNLSEIQGQALTDFLAEIHYVRDVQPGGQLVLRPNYKELASLSAPYVKEIFESIKLIAPDASARDRLEELLNFIQNIPYQRLESYGDNRSAGYMTPIQVLRYNMGDCDSKSTLMASALITAFPRLRVEMVYLPDHALLALGIRPHPKDETVTIKGRKLVLVEPTGPANAPIGQIAPQSSHYIKSGIYHSESINP